MTTRPVGTPGPRPGTGPGGAGTEPTSMTDFDLLALVRSVVEGSSLRGPREIAAKVAENVPQGKLRAALAQALVSFVREDLTRTRQPARRGLSPQRKPGSSKVTAIREAWRRTMAGQFHVGHGQWQVLADCSYENVLFMATERREQARRNADAASMFDALAEAMQEHAVERVAELPEMVLADLLSHEGVEAA